MNGWTIFLILVVLGAAVYATAPDCEFVVSKIGPPNPYVDATMTLAVVDGELSVTVDKDEDDLDYGRAFVDLMLTDPLLVRSPLGEDNGGKEHFDKMAADISRFVDRAGQRELMKWAHQITTDSPQDFFFSAMNTLMTTYPRAGNGWIEAHVFDEGARLDFILLRNLYWVVFTKLMDMNELCEPMGLGARMECYLAFADLLGMTE